VVVGGGICMCRIGKIGVTAYRYRVSFWGDKIVLKFVRYNKNTETPGELLKFKVMGGYDPLQF